jgi:hypothetical protein
LNEALETIMSIHDNPDDPASIGLLNAGQILDWLDLALRGQQALPRMIADEQPHLSIFRLEKTQEMATRQSLRDACNILLRRFCAAGDGDTAYLQELLSLAARLKTPESVPMLVALANRFPVLPVLALEIRYAVLAVLVTGSPPQDYDFWHRILQQDRRYAGRALSGALASNPMQAIQMLRDMPDSERSGETAAAKLDMAWDNLPANQRGQFVQVIQNALPHCGVQFAKPIKAWVTSKSPLPSKAEKFKTLANALRGEYFDTFTQRPQSPKLQHNILLAA